MNNTMKFGIVGFLLGGVLVWGIMTSVRNTNSGQMMGFGTNNSVQKSNTLDAHFIEQMIPHHEDAITMAKLAQTKAQRPEVIQLAQNIIESQSKEIAQMKVWYKDWYGRDLPTGEQVMNTHGMMGNNSGMHMGVRGNELDVAELEDSEDFDIAFVEHMIPHHQMAVMMASMLKGGTQRPEMKTLADDIITTQTAEIDLMRKWLQTW